MTAPTPGEQPPPTTGRRSWFHEFVPLYHALARVGIAAADADRCELWEVAAMVGAVDDDTSADDDGRAMLRARVANAERGGSDRPDWGPPTEAERMQQAALMAMQQGTR